MAGTAPAPVPATLARKLTKVLSTRTDDADLVTALQSLGSFYHDNTLDARRNLRGNIEQRAVTVNAEFVAALDRVQSELDGLDSQVGGMHDACDAIATRLDQLKTTTSHVLARVAALDTEFSLAEEQERVATAFVERFQLSPEQDAALRRDALGFGFFDALDQVRLVQQRCRELVRAKHEAALGMRIIEDMAAAEDEAYQRLFRWIHSECKILARPSAEPSQLLRAAVCELLQRPALLHAALAAIAQRRAHAVAQAFRTALTVGGPGGVPRPIDVHADDPLRYAGDMLALLHQHVASERDMLRSLLPKGVAIVTAEQHGADASAREADNADKDADADDNAEETVDQGAYLSTVFDTAAQAMQQAVQHSLGNDVGAVVAFKLAGLFDFYTATLAGVMGATASLVRVCTACQDAAMAQFHRTLQVSSAHLLRTPPPVPRDLSPPPVLTDALARLTDIMRTFDAGIVPAEAREHRFQPVLAAVLDPLINMVTLAASGLEPGSMAIFMINCLSACHGVLQPYDAFTGPRAAALNDQVAPLLDTLVQEQASITLTRCGLAQRLEALQARPAGDATPLSSVPELAEEGMRDAFTAFSSYLASVGAMVMPECDRVRDPDLRRRAREGVAHLISYCYQTLYHAVHNPSNGYRDPDTITRYTPTQIRTMLDY